MRGKGGKSFFCYLPLAPVPLLFYVSLFFFSSLPIRKVFVLPFRAVFLQRVYPQDRRSYYLFFNYLFFNYLLGCAV